jgi:DNA-binding MarR family transcriptional regulator
MKKSELDLGGTGYCVSFNIRRTARSVSNVFDAALRPVGLRSTTFTILVAVAKAEPVAIGVLSKTLAIDPTTMTRNLRLMQKRAFLAVSARSRNRQRFVTLLPMGRTALIRSIPVWQHTQMQFLNRIGQDFWKDFQAELERLSSIAAEMENSGAFDSQARDSAILAVS